MPGPILHLGATVLCSHAGQATPVVTSPRVIVSGQPVATLASPYVVAGCTLPPAAGGPCVSAQYVTSATRVTANGQPVLLQDSQAICAPAGTPLVAVLTQVRVTAI
jgi:uncharacterized Zn-binding protein involved in type VI secretion